MENFVEVNHYRFHYCVRGRSSHPPILFLHGFLGDLREFDQAMSLLSNQFYCIAIDLPGHGKTQVLGCDRYYTLVDTAEGLVQALKIFSIQKFFLVGYSMGGRIALYLTLNFPEHFHKTLLESASPGLKTEAEQTQRTQRDRDLAQRLETEDLPTFLAQWYSQPLFASLQNHPSFDQMLDHRLQNNPLRLAKSLRHSSTGQQPSLWEKLQHNTVPMLLLAGELDKKFITINIEMAERSPFIQYKTIDRCGHNIHLENTALFIHHIKHFFTEYSTT
ncbi:MAG: 2-succinyl-6-hydroxy-2,4-cyclohexadiene-1-carboxylate synthase [Drouetiella hepatica Uher 2000/2452]|jgi:2-succinyl-6-hydroxy-2,4-cyclohexadiene-1-carboxylate synthase|uniref:Putative 2-succinyl-6-hydroxy-2,4-cyclohexadiene-1-carboxylate synthase n=1 Tax=Drouetiella hepatica Uher 2000/2452 TaxID=904376 RepID=A0A951QE01_9CYAN|nr:2-succinyl-6-hydroxy-2,4-cyclohexadiene-1-carboxylate synthase [Drouetiella hepatica Uher 2000/2452]